MANNGIQLKCSYTDAPNWFRGNLHTHTTRSDGSRPPEQVIADYEARGYDFLVISDHDVLVELDGYQKNTSMTLIHGVEVSARGPHIQQVNATARIEPNADRQWVVDEINKQEAVCVLNHPNWQSHFNHFPQELMESLEGYHGIEIYNGVIERLPGAALATDRWDRLLAKGRVAWGFANDDSHLPLDVELAWNVVRTENCTVDEIVTALKTGCFYGSTGVTITSVETEGATIRVKTKDAQRIRFISNSGVIRSTVDAAEATYTLPENPNDALKLGYVRAECYGTGGRVAWTQPIFIQNLT
ncbi:CehA/McbA family metallohydrolase [Candidatus Poribacteria bacterium]|nr:CehA/McbA family metallohydrolase [Candidatus Poribacteria bacterium]